MHAGAGIRRPRRIVTGTHPDGGSYLARVEAADLIDRDTTLAPGGARLGPPPELGARQTGDALPGAYRLWASDRLPIPTPTDGIVPPLVVEPSPEDVTAALRATSMLPPPLGMRVGMSVSIDPVPPDHLHWTDSIDIVFILEGQLLQILEADEHVLDPGDVLVQTGTMHAHQTFGPTVTGFVNLGGLRVGPQPPPERRHPVSGAWSGHRYPGLGPERDPAAWPPLGKTPTPRAPSVAQDANIRPSSSRVLVTGTNDGGRSYFQRNQRLLRREVEKSNRVGAYFPAWRLRQLPAFLPNPRDELGEPDHADAWEAPPLGVIAGLWELSTNDTPTPTSRPESMDVLFCLSGEAVYAVGDDEVVLRPGDVLIQNGTAHAWHNQGSEETVFGCVSVAAFPLAGGSTEEGGRKR